MFVRFNTTKLLFINDYRLLEMVDSKDADIQEQYKKNSFSLFNRKDITNLRDIADLVSIVKDITKEIIQSAIYEIR